MMQSPKMRQRGEWWRSSPHVIFIKILPLWNRNNDSEAERKGPQSWCQSTSFALLRALAVKDICLHESLMSGKFSSLKLLTSEFWVKGFFMISISEPLWSCFLILRRSAEHRLGSIWIHRMRATASNHFAYKVKWRLKRKRNAHFIRQRIKWALRKKSWFACESA